MKSILKDSKKHRRFSQILFNPSDKIETQKKLHESIDESIKNSELYKQNLSTIKARIVFFYRMKYFLKKRICSPYLETATNYNKMIINNILSNKISTTKERYTEMLNEIESSDLICKYILRKDVYYFLKYLIVVYDKFHRQYPNYLKDINVYFFMSHYLLKKQKVYDLIKKNNNYVYIQKKIRRLLSHKFRDIKLITSNLSHDDTEEENYTKFKQMQGQGFDIDIENSQDSINKLESLVEKLDQNLENPKKSEIYLRVRSKSLRNIDTFLIKNTKLKKPKKVKWSELYDITTKRIMRHQKKRVTEVKFNRKKVFIEKVVEKAKKNKKINKKMTKEELKQNLIKKRNEINEIRKLILENDVGKHNTILDVVKRGFVFNDNDKKMNHRNLLISSYKKKNIKFDENKIENNNQINIKEKIMKIQQKNQNINSKNFNNGINYNLFKKRKYIIKNLNDCLNEYRFYNKIVQNSSQREKYYEKRVIPGLFSNKITNLFNLNNINEKSNKTKIIPLVNMTPQHQKLYNKSCGSSCKKLSKERKAIFNRKINLDNLMLPYNNDKNKSEYYTESVSIESESKNSKLFSNRMERLENSIYNYYKTNKKDGRISFGDYKLNYFNIINLTDVDDTSVKIKKKKIKNNILNINTEYNSNPNSKNKFEDYLRKNKEKLFVLKVNNNNENNKNWTLGINNNKRIKEENSQTLNICNNYQKLKNQNPKNIRFSNLLNINK